MGTKFVLYMPRYYCTIMERHLNGEDTIYKENAVVQYDDENNGQKPWDTRFRILCF